MTNQFQEFMIENLQRRATYEMNVVEIISCTLTNHHSVDC